MTNVSKRPRIMAAIATPFIPVSHAATSNASGPATLTRGPVVESDAIAAIMPYSKVSPARASKAVTAAIEIANNIKKIHAMKAP